MFDNTKEREEYLRLLHKLEIITKSIDDKTIVSMDKKSKEIESGFHSLISSLKFETGISLEKEFSRGIKAKYRTSPLSTDGSLLSNGRYNFKEDKLECLYFTEDEENVDIERKNNLFKMKSPHFKFWVNVKLQNVFNIPFLPLSNMNPPFLIDSRSVIIDLLHHEWLFYNSVLMIKSYTQFLGKVVFDHGYEAILVPSSRVLTKLNLIVFPKNLLIGSSLSVCDPENELGNEPRANIIEGYCVK